MPALAEAAVSYNAHWSLAFRADVAAAAGKLGDWRASVTYEVPEATVSYWREKAMIPRRVVRKPFDHVRAVLANGPATLGVLAKTPWHSRKCIETCLWYHRTHGRLVRTGTRKRYVYALAPMPE